MCALVYTFCVGCVFDYIWEKNTFVRKEGLILREESTMLSLQ